MAESKLGYKWVKWVTRIELSDKPYQGFWEKQGYDNQADVKCPRFFIDRVFYLKYKGSMKVKTSITLSEDLLKVMSEFAEEYKNRSEFIEEAIRAFIKQLIRRQQEARDLKIINLRADYLNREASDVLTYQVDL